MIKLEDDYINEQAERSILFSLNWRFIYTDTLCKQFAISKMKLVL